jgi:type IV pilus assembly protein PilC
MARFKYVAMDSGGSETQGVLDAENESQAVSILRANGLFPTRVNEIQTGAARRGAPVKSGKGLKKDIKLPKFLAGRVKAKQLMVFTRQLATLVDAGLPLLRGLRILLKQEKNQALRDAVNSMGESVEGGSTFSEALAQHPKIFDDLFVNMVRAGEAGGVLDVVLSRLAEFMEKAERIKGRVKSAMVYPVVVLIAAVGIVTFMMIAVIPKFEEIFSGLLGGGELPALTRFVIGISTTVKERGFVVLGVIVGIVVLCKTLAKTKTGALLLDQVKLRMPVFGQLTVRSSIARFSRTLGTLMSSGVPVLQALNIVRDTVGNRVISRAIQGVHDSVKEGDSMAMPMEAAGLFPSMVVSMVDVGEETGALPEMLIRIADNYDDEVDRAVDGMTSVIEPLLIVFLAVVVGTIVIAMFVPLVSIIGQLGGQ